MRLLVVEDDWRMAELLRRGLAGEGWAVDVAHDGPSGLERAGENPYDAILRTPLACLRAELELALAPSGDARWPDAAREACRTRCMSRTSPRTCCSWAASTPGPRARIPR
ncbi:hypothetical protein ACIRVK_27205 [Streptomyces sp. NPDC101152]|uniref:hypothetical protein n=1 Tax=Streptomyces sp. NPDC101152 TaxID=3366116 RepID=UPI003827BFF2